MIDSYLDAFVRQYGWKDKVIVDNVEVDNPVTKLEFARGILVNFFKDVVKAYSMDKAAKLAREQTSSAVDAALGQATVEATLT